MRVPFPALTTMVTVFLLLIGNASKVHPSGIDLGIAESMASIASSVVSAGASLAGTTLETLSDPSSSVTCAIQVENWTRYPLTYPVVLLYGSPGVTSAPTAVLPTKKEAFAVRKPRGTSTGVAGTVSWELQGVERRFVLMWSAPYSFTSYVNWMGVGLTRPGLVDVVPGDKWFHQMYSGSDSDDLTFKRGKFYYNMIPIVYRNGGFEIEAVMTNVHKAQIKVIIRPTPENWRDMAIQIQDTLVKEKEEVCSATA